MRVLSLLLVLGVIGAGCSGSGDSQGGGGMGARYCNLFKPCCAKAGLPDTQEGCRLLFDSAVAQDQAAAEDCIAQYEAWAQAPDWCETWSTHEQPASCEKAFPQTTNGGTKQPGETCDFSDDCAASSKGEVSCYHDFDSATEYCRVELEGTSGSPCVGTRDGNLTVFSGDTSGAIEVGVCDKANGLYCDSSSSTCAPLVAEGGTCQESLSCLGETYCSTTCKAKVPAGSSCSDSSSACAAHTYCNFDTYVCMQSLPDGAPCQTSGECDSSYCDGSVCSKSPGLGGLADAPRASHRLREAGSRRVLSRAAEPYLTSTIDPPISPPSWGFTWSPLVSALDNSPHLSRALTRRQSMAQTRSRSASTAVTESPLT